ncbi:tetratricopeptide repeat protein [Sphingomonas sp. SFZ2018-12]|uniref:hypothetical protein n=1 Tax=Sphingomonas sp. SFZ2018-12 TaxID=2683197 RepID=UPI001F0D200E|nr:hypothetical protein [Sphingomonas sp. SFZ2018-12]MCH4894860.1 tetratricopeptide repeat protein [Sphingomonas sp. SFZ2018-12]
MTGTRFSTPRGLAVSTHDPEVAALLHAFEEELLGYGQGAAIVFTAIARDPECAIAQAYGAAAHLFALTRAAIARARPYLDGARAGRADSARERGVIAAILAWGDGQPQLAIARLTAVLDNEPRDLFAAKLLQYLQFASGRSADMLRTATMLVRHHELDGRVHAMHAFALGETGDARGAERAARRGIALTDDPWAHHALAHAFDAMGRARDGVDWLESHAAAWADCSSFLYTHNWWHAALFHLELGDMARAIELYDARVWARRHDYCQDQINAVALLARLELAGGDVGDRWAELAREIAPFAGDAVDGFLDLHYAYALARSDAGDALGDLIAAADAHAGRDEAPWRMMMPDALAGMIAHATGDYPRAAMRLGHVHDQLHLAGGSVVQRDLFARIAVDALLRSGDIAGARALARRAAPAVRRCHARLIVDTADTLAA